METFAAGVWLEGKRQHDPITAARVNFVMIYWGEENGRDCMIGQISSETYARIEVVLESPTVQGEHKRLTFAPAIQLYGKGEVPVCIECRRCTGYHSTKEHSVFRRDLSGKRKGHAFRIHFEKSPHLRTFNIVNVLADGEPVKYTVGSLADCKVMKDPSSFRSKVRSEHYEVYHDYDCILQNITRTEEKDEDFGSSEKLPLASGQYRDKPGMTTSPSSSDEADLSPFPETSPFASDSGRSKHMAIKTYMDKVVTFSIKGNMIRWYEHPSKDKSTPLEQRVSIINGKRWLPLWDKGACRHTTLPVAIPSGDDMENIEVSANDDDLLIKTIKPSVKNGGTLSVQISNDPDYDSSRRNARPVEIYISW